MIGFFGCLVAFWTLPTDVLAGAGAAIGIAFINIMGNLAPLPDPICWAGFRMRRAR